MNNYMSHKELGSSYLQNWFWRASFPQIKILDTSLFNNIAATYFYQL